MTKTLSKSIMESTRFRNRFLKNSTKFTKLIEKNITDNRKFGQTVKPFLSEKHKARVNITSLNNEEIISDEVEVANTLKTQ